MLTNIKINIFLLLILATSIIILFYVLYMDMASKETMEISLKQRLISCQSQLKQLRTKEVDPKDSVCPGHVSAAKEKSGLSWAYRFPPHLWYNSKSRYLQSRGRSNVSIVLGIPTVRRKRKSFLLATLYNLIENMSQEELKVVYIGESEWQHVEHISEQIEKSFSAYIASGLIDIIAPAANYYPFYLGQDDERVNWHSKQNLDFAYLMAYGHSKGSYYVQLEDDIFTRRQFVTTMRKFTLIQSSLANPFKPTWFVLDFCTNGFIGKLFKAAELPYVITYLQLFYNDMTALQILSYLIKSKMCHYQQDEIECNELKDKLWQHFDDNLFQHASNILLKDIKRIGEGKQEILTGN